MARKILLADDSVTAQNMGRRILTDAGYEVVTVNNGSAALKKIAEAKPDLIILDVYMPGYGGLEVCQRLKEAPETARIPVLLSVGKLEPFKVDEARRVHADGHIIKPFEASELLTALTKLEDKIVPEKDSFKPGRFAKAIASAEQLSASQSVAEDTSWKSRLTIPAATPKSEETGTPASQSEDAKLAAMKSAEAAVAAALPQGITPEELAALAAAASSFAGKTESAEVKSTEVESREGVESSEAKSEAAEVSGAAATESISGPVETPAEVPAEEKADSVEVPEPATFASAPSGENEERRESHQTPAQAAEMQRATTDAEVLAALASLSPSHGEVTASAESAGSNGDHAGAHHGEPVSVGTTASSGEQVTHVGASGPRWIAQSVAIAEDESALVLEREMEKAYAAMAALEAESTPAVVEAVASSVEPSANPEEPSSQAKSEDAPQSPQEQTAVVAESVPEVTVPEISSPEAAGVAAATENVDAVSETSIPVANEGAAYAAAAGSGTSESTAPAEVSNPVESVAAPALVEPARESELAAAWQNWKQIRESMVASIPATPKAELAAPVVENPAPASVASEDETASESGGETSEISSIVDTMLAELKPKLMEEISKKMGKSKRKK